MDAEWELFLQHVKSDLRGHIAHLADLLDNDSTELTEEISAEFVSMALTYKSYTDRSDKARAEFAHDGEMTPSGELH